jgi:hypothetical protein
MTSSRGDRCISWTVGLLTATQTSPPGMKLRAPDTVSVPCASIVFNTKLADSVTAGAAGAPGIAAETNVEATAIDTAQAPICRSSDLLGRQYVL